MEAEMDTPVVDEIVRKLKQLPTTLQQQVLIFVDTLQVTSARGKPGSWFSQFAGKISPSDLALMQQAIDAGCERVDTNEW
jgi:hypothetical protein